MIMQPPPSDNKPLNTLDRKTLDDIVDAASGAIKDGQLLPRPERLENAIASYDRFQERMGRVLKSAAGDTSPTLPPKPRTPEEVNRIVTLAEKIAADEEYMGHRFAAKAIVSELDKLRSEQPAIAKDDKVTELLLERVQNNREKRAKEIAGEGAHVDDAHQATWILNVALEQEERYALKQRAAAAKADAPAADQAPLKPAPSPNKR